MNHNEISPELLSEFRKIGPQLLQVSSELHKKTGLSVCLLIGVMDSNGKTICSMNHSGFTSENGTGRLEVLAGRLHSTVIEHLKVHEK